MWMRINLELRIHLETPLKGFFPWNSVGVFLWNFSRNTIWNAFQDFSQESFHIFHAIFHDISFQIPSGDYSAYLPAYSQD